MVVRHMKRRLWFLAAFLVVVLSGCNRAQVADLILAVAYHPRFDRSHGDSAKKTATATTTNSANQSFEQLLAAMLEMNEIRLTARAGQVDGERITGIIDRIHASSEELADSSELTAAERRQLREAELAALKSAAELAPAQFRQLYDDFSRTHFQHDSAAVDGAEASALRILDEYLTANALPPTARYALTLHTLSYPSCSMNVQLFSTMAERLANEKHLAASIQIATDGTKLCSHLPGVQKLQGQIDRIFAEQPAAPGLPFRLSGPTTDGRMVNVADLRGKVLVVTFWATWCPDCPNEVRALQRLQDSYRQDGVEFIGVSLDENHEEFSRYLQDNGITWPQIFVAKKGQTRWNNPLVRYYRVTKIPFTLIVDKQGVIAESGIRGEANIENAILDQLAR